MVNATWDGNNIMKHDKPFKATKVGDNSAIWCATIGSTGSSSSIKFHGYLKDSLNKIEELSYLTSSEKLAPIILVISDYKSMQDCISAGQQWIYRKV
jgi:hypothetical protein